MRRPEIHRINLFDPFLHSLSYPIAVVIGILLITCCGEPNNINTEANFPDPNFRTGVEEFMQIAPGGGFSAQQAAAKTGLLDCARRHIRTLAGLEYFLNITRLNCSENYQLRELDLSHNTALIELDCSWGILQRLDLSHNPLLTVVNCERNWLTSLDLSHNPELIRLNCRGNALTALDTKNNPELTWLDCSWNQLRTLDFSDNPQLSSLYCQYNNLIDLNLLQNQNMSTLYFGRNGLTQLKVSLNAYWMELNGLNNAKTDIHRGGCSLCL